MKYTGFVPVFSTVRPTAHYLKTENKYTQTFINFKHAPQPPRRAPVIEQTVFIHAGISQDQYLKFIHTQTKPPVLKQVIGADVDTIFVSDEQTPKGEKKGVKSSLKK